jgi:D-inositol-3-phosphate glycosyltransferase
VKVLLVSHYLLPHSGGIEVLVDREARLLTRAGHEVVLLASAVGSGQTPEYPASVHVCRVMAWNGLERLFQVPWPVFSPLLLWRTWRLVRWCDVVHAHGFLYLSSVFALLFAWLLGKPSVLTEHIGLAWYRSRLLRLPQWVAVETVGRLSSRAAGKCIGFHDNVLALLRRLAGPNADVADLPNPLDQTTFHPPGKEERWKARAELGWIDGRPRVLFVGRLLLRKGIDLLLQARDPRYDLVFCGRGDPAVLGEVDGKEVSYLPPRPQADLAKVYHAADVLAVPSRCEGNLVLVAQEALACGLPVLLGDDPGLARYRRCAGLHFTQLTADAIRRSLLAILGLQGESSTGTVPLEQLFPSEEEWLHRVYGLPSPTGSPSNPRQPSGRCVP